MSCMIDGCALKLLCHQVGMLKLHYSEIRFAKSGRADRLFPDWHFNKCVSSSCL